MTLDIGGFVPLIQVFDMPTSVAFYRDVLGFQIVAQSEAGDDFDWGMLKRDGMFLMLNTAYERHDRPQKPDPTRIAPMKTQPCISSAPTRMPRMRTFARRV